MNIERLSQITQDCTRQFRKGEAVTEKATGGLMVVDVYMMPHADEADKKFESVDVWFIKVGVDKGKAEGYRDEVIQILDQWPNDRLRSGISYIEIGGELGSQDLALMLMALGKVLGFWSIASPLIFGGEPGDAKSDELAGNGFVMTTGFNKNAMAVS